MALRFRFQHFHYQATVLPLSRQSAPRCSGLNRQSRQGLPKQAHANHKPKICILNILNQWGQHGRTSKRSVRISPSVPSSRSCSVPPSLGPATSRTDIETLRPPDNEARRTDIEKHIFVFRCRSTFQMSEISQDPMPLMHELSFLCLFATDIPDYNFCKLSGMTCSDCPCRLRRPWHSLRLVHVIFLQGSCYLCFYHLQQGQNCPLHQQIVLIYHGLHPVRALDTSRILQGLCWLLCDL